MKFYRVYNWRNLNSTMELLYFKVKCGDGLITPNQKKKSNDIFVPTFAHVNNVFRFHLLRKS